VSLATLRQIASAASPDKAATAQPALFNLEILHTSVHKLLRPATLIPGRLAVSFISFLSVPFYEPLYKFSRLKAKQSTRVSLV